MIEKVEKRVCYPRVNYFKNRMHLESNLAAFLIFLLFYTRSTSKSSVSFTPLDIVRCSSIFRIYILHRFSLAFKMFWNWLRIGKYRISAVHRYLAVSSKFQLPYYFCCKSNIGKVALYYVQVELLIIYK